MTRIVHAADLHLRADEQSRDCLQRLEEVIERESADLLLLAGDVTDGTETVSALEAFLNRLSIPTFIAPGNHDFYTESGVYARMNLPECVHVFKGHDIECVELERLGMRVFGAAFTDSVCNSLLAEFRAERKEGYSDILSIHGELTQGTSVYNAISRKQIENANVSYVALGHVHAYSGALREGDTVYAYPGCTFGRGYDECGEKGVIALSLSAEGEVCDFRFVPLGMSRYEVLEVDCTGAEDVMTAVLKATGRDASRDNYRVILRGETESAVDVSALREKVRAYYGSLQLRDETSIKPDVWARTEEDSLRGAFLRVLRARYESGDSAEKECCELAAVYGLRAMDGEEALR